MKDPVDVDDVARRIAWAHWKAMNPRDRCKDPVDLWECLGDHHRTAYRAAAIEVVSG